MKFFTVLSAVVAVAVAQPDRYVAVTQDTVGNYNLKYDVGDITRSEQGNPDGSVQGSYSYVGLDGILRTVAYTSGINGFQVSGNDLPVPVRDVPEVEIARANHFLALQRAGAVGLPLAPVLHTSVPVFGGIPETPEVAAARAAHLRIHAAARGRHF